MSKETKSLARDSLTTLIDEAIAKSPEFESKYNYWINERKQSPDMEWLLRQLRNVLGSDRLLEEVQKLSTK